MLYTSDIVSDIASAKAANSGEQSQTPAKEHAG
jgi:hypothetical protein